VTKKATRGRPPQFKQTRSKQIMVRVTPDHHAEIVRLAAAAAEKAGYPVTVSDWMLAAAREKAKRET
jgi:uncharacterized protein (DUF1778 family)